MTDKVDSLVKQWSDSALAREYQKKIDSMTTAALWGEQAFQKFQREHPPRVTELDCRRFPDLTKREIKLCAKQIALWKQMLVECLLMARETPSPSPVCEEAEDHSGESVVQPTGGPQQPQPASLAAETRPADSPQQPLVGAEPAAPNWAVLAAGVLGVLAIVGVGAYFAQTQFRIFG